MRGCTQDTAGPNKIEQWHSWVIEWEVEPGHFHPEFRSDGCASTLGHDS